MKPSHLHARDSERAASESVGQRRARRAAPPAGQMALNRWWGDALRCGEHSDRGESGTATRIFV